MNIIYIYTVCVGAVILLYRYDTVLYFCMVARFVIGSCCYVVVELLSVWLVIVCGIVGVVMC